MSQSDAAYYMAPYAHIAKHVVAQALGRREIYTRTWWRHTRPRPEMNQAIAGLSRFIVTARVAKHRLFVWMTHPTLPDSATIVSARDDDTTFGILHSRFHEVWSLRLGSALEDRPRYTPSTTFETFPFPDGLAPNTPVSAYAADPNAVAIAAAAKALVDARDRWLNPPELVDIVPEVMPGFPDRLMPKDPAAAITLKERTLTSLYNMRGTSEGTWLDNLHRALDEAVAAAYGWSADITEDEALARLWALNLKRSERT